MGRRRGAGRARGGGRDPTRAAAPRAGAPPPRPGGPPRAPRLGLLPGADIEEGAALRAAGVRAEILVFGALSVSDLDGVFDCRLTPTISSPGAARAVAAAAARHRRRLRYHLKIDTGMNRLGFRFDNLRRTLPEVLGSEHLELDAGFTH